ncbi:MAG: 16S rRNA (cytidine(1402)-2'-O)-methyltransferase [Candidatus Berkelbacteria bacterium]|nr:16S rRNA (cytidine(1402)-2'-O)-methyltransferase [Candidatus Berkelbacteria bacterium]MCR4307214.1 16S rRNA (cytidine(1402)-2'-O)-methyltransferase [Candidatus Berkelbacteria bacterium]
MLYIIGTPIGNLGDITFRAIEVLKSADKIYCEDTRRTAKLLAHFEIQKPLESFHEHSEGKIERIVAELKQGNEIAYVSDAGTPGINDPGGKLVAVARDAGIVVSPIPGPSSVTALLSVAGIAADKFCFMGFVPTKKGRETFIKKMLSSEMTVVFFETAPRLHKLFDQLIALGGESRQLIVGRELTKKFEEIQTGTPVELKGYFSKPLGEFVLVLAA